MDTEFLDPGPYQPVEPLPAGRPGSRPPSVREVAGLLIMLTAAAVLPVVAAFQSVYAVREQGTGGAVDFTVDGWGRYGTVGRTAGITIHAPRFGILLVAGGVAFALLALVAATRLLGRRAARDAARRSGSAGSAGSAGSPNGAGPGSIGSTAAALAGSAAALVGLLTGGAVAMVLEIDSVFAGLRSNASGFSGPAEVRLRIGAAVWLTLAGLLAGGLAVSAALRLRRAQIPPRPPAAGMTTDTPHWR